MRTLVAAVLCVIVVGLMTATPVSAVSKTYSVADRPGDMGKPWYSGDQGSHEFGDPYSWYSGNCPMANADYLDMLSQWITIKNDKITMGMTVAAPFPVGGELPEAVTQCRWSWFFYPSLDIYTGPNYASIYAVYLVWEGADFVAALVDRTGGTMPFTVTYLEPVIVGNMVTITTALANIPVVAGWFCDTIIDKGPSWQLDQLAPMNGWWAPDLTDIVGPLAVYWPWQPMP